MLTGSLRSNGCSFGKRQVGKALKIINSVASSQRKMKACRLSKSKVCSAECFGYKIHYDQNKKLGMYGAA